MIDLSINKVGLEHNIQKAKENHIIIPTIAQMQNPDLIPEKIKAKLSTTGLWDVDPVNLFRISWHNEAKESGGLFQGAVPEKGDQNQRDALYPDSLRQPQSPCGGFLPAVRVLPGPFFPQRQAEK